MLSMSEAQFPSTWCFDKAHQRTTSEDAHEARSFLQVLSCRLCCTTNAIMLYRCAKGMTSLDHQPCLALRMLVSEGHVNTIYCSRSSYTSQNDEQPDFQQELAAATGWVMNPPDAKQHRRLLLRMS